MLMMYRTIKKVDEVKLTDAVSSDDAIKMESEITFIIQRGLAKLLIDLSDLQSINIDGVEVLARCNRHAIKRNGWLVLVNPSRHVRSLFKTNSITTRLPIHCHGLMY